MAGIPSQHLVESQKLSADALVDLFELNPKGTSSWVYFKNNDEVVWQGKTYEQVACQLTGVGVSADDEQVRPQLMIFNPEGVFNYFAISGALEQSVVTIKQVLRSHLDSNVNVFRQRVLVITRISSIVGATLSLELRSVLDGPNFVVPARFYLPPEFPVVSL